MPKEKQDNEILVSAKRDKDGKYEISDERYILVVRKVFDKGNNEAVLKGRGNAVQRCVKIATHTQLDGILDREKTEALIGFGEVERERKDGSKYNKRVEEIDIKIRKQ